MLAKTKTKTTPKTNAPCFCRRCRLEATKWLSATTSSAQKPLYLDDLRQPVVTPSKQTNGRSVCRLPPMAVVLLTETVVVVGIAVAAVAVQSIRFSTVVAAAAAAAAATAGFVTVFSFKGAQTEASSMTTD